MNDPLVSICIPTYNSASYLAQSLDSIVSQTYHNIEVIISDNASTDETPEIINNYCNRYGWTFYKNEINIGAGNNFNKLVELANGEYIAIYHADDIYDPTIVEKSVSIFETNNVGLVGTMGDVINSSNQTLHPFQLPKCLESHKEILFFDDVIDSVLSSNTQEILLITPSIMVKKECYTKLGNFQINKRYKSAGDYEMWLRIAYHYPIHIINKPLIQYRIHSGQGSEMEIRQNLEINDIVIVMDDYIKKITDITLRKKFHKWKDKLLIRTALKQNAASLYTKSNTTLKEINKIKYFIPKIFLIFLNTLKVSLPYAYLKTFYQKLQE